MTQSPRWITPEEARVFMAEGTGRGVRVAILDSGVETRHPSLHGVVLRDDLAVVEDGLGLGAVPGEGRDTFGHGTAVAGIILATAPEAELGSIRVLGENLKARTAIIREGALRAMELGYDILNCSFGCGVMEHVLHYKDWVDEAYLRGVHIVAACNNFDCGKPEWPGHFPTVITVNMARVDAGSLYCRPGSLVEFLALGVDQQVPWKDSTVKEVTGSSFAAARVAGFVARLLSRAPALPPLKLKALLHRAAVAWSPTTG